MSEERNVLVESARIARGNIKPLSEFDAKDFDCLLLPGGVGAITNWCDFNTKGVDCNIENSITNTLNLAYNEHLVIGAMCIAPVVVALVLGKYGVKVTIGNDEKVAKTIEKTGAIHINTEVDKTCVDTDNLIVTTPAYMLADSIKDVFKGANNLVKDMVNLATKD
jgi:enhancing lycopene biosynthesis protein 2